MPKYYVNPFAVNGDREPIPDATDPNGFVSYDSGWGFDYERDPDPTVDPLTKDIEREKTNSILFEITENIKFLQDTGGVPEWSSIRAGAGGYPRDAKVSLAGTIWTSTVNSNASTPGVSGTWILGGQTDPTIISIAALTPTANQMIYFTGTDQAAVTAITSFGRSLIAANDAIAGRALLGINVATDTAAGLVEWATDAEVNSGTANRAVEARQLRLGFQAQFGETGYIRFPTWLGGYTRVWGIRVSNVSANVNVNQIYPGGITFLETPNGQATYANSGSPATKAIVNLHTVSVSSITYNFSLSGSHSVRYSVEGRS